MNRLHRIRGRNTYCGPAALSALADISTDDAARRIRDITGDRAIRGVSPRDLHAAAKTFGLRLRWTEYSRIDHEASRMYRRIVRIEYIPAPPTLGRYLKDAPPGRHVIAVTGHYIVAAKDREGAVTLADSLNRRPMPDVAHFGARRIVRSTWIEYAPPLDARRNHCTFHQGQDGP